VTENGVSKDARVSVITHLCIYAYAHKSQIGERDGYYIVILNFTTGTLNVCVLIILLLR
jgi:hypothetical protein